MIVELDIFSGRENPRWSLPENDAAELIGRVSDLPEAGVGWNEPPALGYRGFIVEDVRGLQAIETLHVYDGLVRGLAGGVGAELRADRERALEKWLLRSGRGELRPILFEQLQTAFTAS